MTDRRLLVRPGPGCLVRLLDGRRLTEDGNNFTFKCPEGGVEISWSLYIQRRLDCGDLVEVKDAPAAGDAKAKTPPAPAPTQASDSK
jgi:hypothetical protein